MTSTNPAGWQRALAAIAVLLSPLAPPVARAGAARTAPADLLFVHGAVYTLDAARSWAEAVAVRGGRIVYVGGDAGAARLRGPRTRVVDLAGKMLLPGFHDAHVHPVSGGIDLGRCDLSSFETKPDLLAAIGRCAAEHRADRWLVGGGWGLPLFTGGNPTRQELDAVVADRPAFLSAADGHSAWLSSAGLALAGLTRDTPDPPNGRIERDATGAPSGTLRESAVDLVAARLPQPTAEEARAGLARGLALAGRFGITSLIEAHADERILAAYDEAARRGRLTARVTAMLGVDVDRPPAELLGQVPELVRRRARYSHGLLRADGVKIFADGVIESETAALLAPYLDRPGWTGKANLDAEPFARLVTALDAAGFRIHVHAIGDRAVRMSLDALEAARRANGPRDARPLLAHLELVDPADVPRFRRLGVLAVFQPLWAHADRYIRELTIPILGPERSGRLYPIGSLAASGALVVGGSDWNVTSMNPLEAIEVGVTRRAPGARPDDPASPPFLPEQRVDLPAMLAAYTINGAYAGGQERDTGSIEPGKAADLVVLDRNLFEIAPEQIHAARVLWTLLGGREVYRDPGFTPEKL